MIIARADQLSFPKVTQYVRDSLPGVANIDSVCRAFRRFAQMDRASLQAALAWGSQPTLKFVDLVNADGGFLFGEFTPDSGSNELRINLKMAQDFEVGPTPNFVGRNARGARVYLLGVTILHELVHWGDDRDGIDFPEEEGEAFERAVYGRVVG